MFTGTQVFAEGNRTVFWCVFDGHFGPRTAAGAGSEPWDIRANELGGGEGSAVSSPYLAVWSAKPGG